MNNEELKMLKNGRRFLFVGGALDGKWAFVDKNESDVYHEVYPKMEASPLAENIPAIDGVINYTVQHYRKCFKFDGVKRTDYFELVT